MTSPSLIEPNYRMPVIDDNQAMRGDLRNILLGEVKPEKRPPHDEAFLFATEALPITRFEIGSANQGQEGLPDTLGAVGEPAPRWVPAAVTTGELDTSMVADEDIRARNGLVLNANGEQLTNPRLERLRSFATAVGIVQPISVLLPQESAFHGLLKQNLDKDASLQAKSEGPAYGASFVLQSAKEYR
jgi:hypothetical protein